MHGQFCSFVGSHAACHCIMRCGSGEHVDELRLPSATASAAALHVNMREICAAHSLVDHTRGRAFSCQGGGGMCH